MTREDVQWLSVQPCGTGEGWNEPRMGDGVKKEKEVVQFLSCL